MASHYSTLQVRQALKRLGFSDNEIKVLVFLFYAKKSTARNISRETAIAFSSIQYCLSNLLSRELVRVTPSAEDSFEIVSEKELFEWIDKAKEENEQIYDTSKNEIHNFLSIIQKKSWKPMVQYYEGREGIIEIYEDMLKIKGSLYSFIDLEAIDKLLGNYMVDFINKRVEKNIRTYAIMPKNKFNLKHDPKGKEKREIKWVKELPLNGEIRIYDDNVAVMTFDGEKPVGFVFSGNIITNLFKTVFQALWDQNKD
jgi:sugar-specific transcriptional regulator TrmB